VQTAHGATRPLDRPTTEYSTCVTMSGPLHQVSYSCHDPRHCMPCHSCHLHTTRQANTILQANKNKGRTNETVPYSNSNLAKSMTHHNKTKELTTWFLRCSSSKGRIIEDNRNEHLRAMDVRSGEGLDPVNREMRHLPLWWNPSAQGKV
jgi:hypothetical protein